MSSPILSSDKSLSVDGEEWEELMSKTHKRVFWFNKRTGESVWIRPTSNTLPGRAEHLKESAMSAESDDGKRPAAASDDIEMTKCPQNLSGKRDFLFRGYDPAKKSKFIIDEVAAFSVTESQSADEMTRVILAEFPKDSGMKSASDLVILDGMACVGGNTISFSKAFKRTLSNELDEGRFKILRHNVVEVMGCSNVEFFNNSILDLVKDVEFDVLFLDPEWGGPSYKDSSSLRLSISDVAMEDFVLKVFHDFPGVSMVALKLPVNYDNAYLKSFADSNGLSYQFFVKFRKMTLTILKRKRV